MLNGGAGSKHSQKPGKGLMICPHCRDNMCSRCVDRFRLIYRQDRLCQCSRASHEDEVSGEVRLRQIKDPENGDIYGGRKVITTDGEVRDA